MTKIKLNCFSGRSLSFQDYKSIKKVKAVDLVLVCSSLTLMFPCCLKVANLFCHIPSTTNKASSSPGFTQSIICRLRLVYPHLWKCLPRGVFSSSISLLCPVCLLCMVSVFFPTWAQQAAPASVAMVMSEAFRGRQITTVFKWEFFQSASYKNLHMNKPPLLVCKLDIYSRYINNEWSGALWGINLRGGDEILQILMVRLQWKSSSSPFIQQRFQSYII